MGKIMSQTSKQDRTVELEIIHEEYRRAVREWRDAIDAPVMTEVRQIVAERAFNKMESLRRLFAAVCGVAIEEPKASRGTGR